MWLLHYQVSKQFLWIFSKNSFLVKITLQKVVVHVLEFIVVVQRVTITFKMPSKWNSFLFLLKSCETEIGNDILSDNININTKRSWILQDKTYCYSIIKKSLELSEIQNPILLFSIFYPCVCQKIYHIINYFLCWAVIVKS